LFGVRFCSVCTNPQIEIESKADKEDYAYYYGDDYEDETERFDLDW
jgi:hypothetical protein